MGTTKVSWRDFGYFLFGISITLLFMELFVFRFMRSHDVMQVGRWLSENNAKDIELKLGVRLIINSSSPGIVAIFMPGRYSEKALAETTLWLVNKHCPYGIINVYGNENHSPN